MGPDKEQPPLKTKLLTIARAKGLWPQQKPPYTEDQRQFELNDLLSNLIGPFDNIDVWLVAIKAVSDKRKRVPYLLFKERDQILEAYTWYSTDLNTPNVPVSELLTAADVADVTKHPLLSKICFNYDGILRVEERYQKAWEELKAGKRKSIDHNDPDLMPLKRWVEAEFGSLGNFRRPYTPTEVVEIFDRLSQTTEHGLKVSDALGGDRRLIDTLAGIVGLMQPGELIKAVKPSNPFFPSYHIRPTIVQRYTNRPLIRVPISSL